MPNPIQPREFEIRLLVFGHLKDFVISLHLIVGSNILFLPFSLVCTIFCFLLGHESLWEDLQELRSYRGKERKSPQTYRRPTLALSKLSHKESSSNRDCINGVLQIPRNRVEAKGQGRGAEREWSLAQPRPGLSEAMGQGYLPLQSLWPPNGPVPDP